MATNVPSRDNLVAGFVRKTRPRKFDTGLGVGPARALEASKARAIAGDRRRAKRRPPGVGPSRNPPGYKPNPTFNALPKPGRKIY